MHRALRETLAAAAAVCHNAPLRMRPTTDSRSTPVALYGYAYAYAWRFTPAPGR